MIENIFRNKKANFDKLIKFGFRLENDVYIYETNILNGEFKLIVHISKEGTVATQTLDNSTQEEYVLHHLSSATGEFVGMVKSEIEKVLNEISQKCFENEIFKSKQAKEILEYASKNFESEPEFLWQKFPDIAVLRREESGKWFAVLFVLPKKKLDFKSENMVEIVNLHLDTAEQQKLIDGKHFFEGYHMNKKSWLTICLDEGVESSKILSLLKESYDLAKK